MDVDPHRGVVAFGVGLAEHAVGDVGLRGGRSPWAARGKIIEQLAQAAALAERAAGPHPRQFGEEELLLEPCAARA